VCRGAKGGSRIECGGGCHPAIALGEYPLIIETPCILACYVPARGNTNEQLGPWQRLILRRVIAKIKTWFMTSSQ